MKLSKSISVLAAAAAAGVSLLSPVAAESVTLSVMTFNVYFLSEFLFPNWGQSKWSKAAHFVSRCLNLFFWSKSL